MKEHVHGDSEEESIEKQEAEITEPKLDEEVAESEPKKQQSHKPVHKKHEKQAKEARESERSDEFNLDFSSLKRFFANKERNAIMLTGLLILIPVLLTFYIRLTPEYLPQTDSWAENAVTGYFKNQIASAVNTQYPNLPQANKDQLVNQQYEDFKKTNKALIDQQIQQTSNYFKTGFRYEENNYTYTFLGDLDSYFYLRQAKNVEAKGMVCDEVRDGICWDTYILAPIGGNVLSTMHPYGIVFVHRVIGFFDNGINLMRASFLLPTLLAAIAAISAFFIGRRLMNEAAGFFAAMFVALNPMLITRTLGSDTDIWNIVFPLLIVWVFLESFEAESLLKKSAFAGVTGLLMGLFSFAWSGWWYMFDFILAAVLGYFAIIIMKNYFEHKHMSRLFTIEIKSNLIVIGILFVSAAVFVSLFSSITGFFAVFVAPFSIFTTLKSAAHETLWPNVFTTVAELNEADLATIVSSTSFGMSWLFALALLGIVLTMVKRAPDLKEYALIAASLVLYLYLSSQNAFSLSPYVYVAIMMMPIAGALILFIYDKHSQVDIKPALLFVVWFAGMTIASIKGVRFILLLTPVFAIAVGVGLGYVFQYVSRIISSELKLNRTISHVITFIAICMLLTVPIRAGISAGETFTPSMTSGWWDSLTKIRMESKPDAIINSWWDFGHWFKYVADRRVTLDGVTQNHPNAHWLGLILQTSSEREAVGILRMLDCGSNNAFEEVNRKFNDTEKSENIISKLVVMSKTDGEEYLSEIGFSPAEVKAISNLTYCNPPENYFITSEDMVGKAGVWAHFGLWNFDRAYMVNIVRPKPLDEGIKILKDRFNYTEQQATSTYYELQALQTDREMNDWISTWPNYFIGSWVGCVEKNQTVQDNSTGEPTEVNKTFLLCTINRVINQDSNGKTLLEGAIYDIENPEKSTLVISTVDNAGIKRGSGKATPSELVIFKNDTIERLKMQNSSFGMNLLMDTVNQRILMTDPQLSESMFTKLFYLDGRYTEHFEKFSDLTDMTGLRIIVWKVKWPEP